MNITEKTIKTKVLDFLRKYGISDKSKILVAYSGGPDSSALLWVLNDIQKSLGFSLHAAYIDHGIRSEKEMSDEYIQIEKIVAELDIPCYIRHIAPGEIASESKVTGRSIEDIAREYRYRLVEEIKIEIDASHIAMGHTLDDQFETLIMRFFQGSGINGLAGIPQKREYFIRPLIMFEKREIMEYINSNSIPYVVDKTNLDTAYLRNKVRLKLIPVIAEIFPGYRKSLSTFLEKMDSIRSVLTSNNPPLGVKLTKGGDTWFYSDDFFAKPDYQQVETLYKSWDMWENRPFNRLSYRFISAALNYKPVGGSNILIQGYNCQLLHHKEKIIWKRVVVLSSKKSYLKVIEEGDQEIFPGFSLHIEELNEFPEDTVWFSRENLKNPVIIRSKMTGDGIHLAEGFKPIKKLFSDWGVLPEDRWKIPVIEDRSGIIAVLGKPFGFKNRIAITYKNNSPDSGKFVVSASYMEMYK